MGLLRVGQSRSQLVTIDRIDQGTQGATARAEAWAGHLGGLWRLSGFLGGFLGSLGTPYGPFGARGSADPFRGLLRVGQRQSKSVKVGINRRRFAVAHRGLRGPPPLRLMVFGEFSAIGSPFWPCGTPIRVL